MNPRYHLLPLIFLFIFCTQVLNAQEEQKPPRKYEFGLNITGTLASFLNSSGIREGVDPYLMSLRLINRKNIIRFGLAASVEQKEETDPATFVRRDINETRFSLRAGLERRIEITPRFACYWGIDAIGIFRKNSVKSVAFFGSASLVENEFGIGAGPVFGMRYALHPRVVLSTEAALYAVKRFSTEKQDIPPDLPETIKNSSFKLTSILPSSLYINFLF